jgi:hypothetical protein
MAEQNEGKRSYGWLLAVAVIGIAAGCAIATTVQSFGREPFSVDAIESTVRHGSGWHVCEVAVGLSSQGVGLRAAASRVGLGLYRLIQGTRFALSAKNFLGRWFR